ncbi:helix-turn-helix domain-containing protein [Cedecea colo]|uniref:helix-turn-helix domain-containing protein n=1 Tax=Cedecea colo TaxID=2552946 RepID=UPI001F265F77|nr:AraC family transcriptional regulator [Cedecea colo]
MTNGKAELYARRFEQVFTHIEQHLDCLLTVEQLSAIACFSRCHFHRQFSLYCGVSISRYITLMRLKRASFRLVNKPQDKVIDIALDAGFENPESFSRAFKYTFGLSPSEFRKDPVWVDRHVHFQFPGRETQQRMERMDVKIINVAPIKVAAIRCGLIKPWRYLSSGASTSGMEGSLSLLRMGSNTTPAACAASGITRSATRDQSFLTVRPRMVNAAKLRF